MSKKYKEELDKIVMSEDMKKRILHNVLNENIQIKSKGTEIKKPNTLKRNMNIIAACFAVVACLSVVKNNPQLLKHDNDNFKQKEISKDIDDKNKELQGIEESLPYDSNKDGEASKNSKENNKDIQNHDELKAYESINQYTSDNENYKKSDSSKQNANNDLNDNKNSSKAKQNENNNLNDNENSPKTKQNVNNDLSDNENSSKARENENNDSDGNENSSKTKQNEKSVDNSVGDSSGALKTMTKPPTNVKDELTSQAKLDDKSEEITKSQDQGTDNDENSKPEKAMLATYGGFTKEYKTLEEAEGAINLEINSIKELPKEFNIDNISVISNDMIQIEYNNGEDIVEFRAGKDIDNISGDYNIYEIKNTSETNGTSVSLEGNENKLVNLATWKKDDVSYSLSSRNGIDEEIILNMIKSSL